MGLFEHTLARISPATRLLTTIFLLGAISAILLASSLAPTSRTTFGGRNGNLLYAVDGSLYVAGPRGGRGRRLVDGTIWDAAWASDGRRFVFASGDPEATRPTPITLFTARADGTGKRRLTSLPPLSERNPASADLSPNWLPDGKRILFHREIVDTRVRDDYLVDLFIVSTEGGRPTRLTHSPDVWEHEPAVSADGRTVAFSLEDQGAGQPAGIFLASTDGRNQRRLTTVLGFDVDESPAWSPDGRHVAFTRNHERLTEVYVVAATGTGLRRLTRGRRGYAPVWSPDGRWITFCTFPKGADKPAVQYVVPASGGAPQRLRLDPPGCVADWQALPAR